MKTIRALGGAHVPPTKLFPRLAVNQGLKYLKISTTHREGRWRGRRSRARRGTEARSAEGVGFGEGRRSPSPVWASEGIAPRKILNFNSANLFIFFPRFQDRDSSSIRCFSFIYCLYLFLSSPDRAQKLISSSMSRHLSTRNISSKSMHMFWSNLAYRQTDRQTLDKRTRANAFISSFLREIDATQTV